MFCFLFTDWKKAGEKLQYIVQMYFHSQYKEVTEKNENSIPFQREMNVV